jgi:hypothetical protein
MDLNLAEGFEPHASSKLFADAVTKLANERSKC